MTESGLKYDDGKLPFHLMPWDSLEEVVKVMDYGAKKYSENNWRKGFAWSRVLSACFRHLSSWILGEDNDKETGLSHLAHAICCLLFLLWYQKHGVGVDDRYRTDVLADSSYRGKYEKLRALVGMQHDGHNMHGWSDACFACAALKAAEE